MAELNITMPRGDIRNIKFCVRDGEQPKTDFTEIYFTVKKTAQMTDVLFQKKLSDGTIIPAGDGYFRLTIEAADTEELSYGTYRFDIEVVGDGIKQTTVGQLKLTDEVTFASNEE